MNDISKQLSELELFLSQYRNKNTLLSYEKSMRMFYTFLGTYYPNLDSLESVTLELMIDFQSKLMESQKPESINATISAIRKFFDFLFIRGITKTNQIKALKPVPVNRREQKTSYLNAKEVKKLVKYTNDLGGSPYDISNKILVLILLNSGMRTAEMSSLKMQDMAKENGCYVLTILGKNSRFRHVTLPLVVSERLDVLIAEFENAAYKLDKDDYLIQRCSVSSVTSAKGALGRGAMVERVSSLAKGAGISKAITTHSLRRTLATMLYRNDVSIENIQRIMGHDEIKTTMRYIDAEADKDISLKCAVGII